MGSMKTPFSTRSAGEHRTSMGGPFCQKSDLVPVTADGRVQETKRSLDWRGCTQCHLGGDAGRGEGPARRAMRNSKRAAMNTGRGGVAETIGKTLPCDLHNAKCPL